MMARRLYTDGSCATPGAVGGWAWILVGAQPARRRGVPGSARRWGPGRCQGCRCRHRQARWQTCSS